MTNNELSKRISQLIVETFHVSSDYAGRLTTAALNGIDSHGGDPEDWETIVATVNVVVKSWIEDGSFKSDQS